MPGIAIVTEPQYLAPINNNLYFKLTASGNDFNLPQFEYLAKIYVYEPNGTNQTEVGSVSARPDLTGAGQLNIAHKIRAFIKPGIKYFTPSTIFEPDQAVAYRILGGFRWNPNLSYGFGATSGQSGAFRGAQISPTDYANTKKPAGWNWGAGPYYYVRLKIDLLPAAISHGLSIGDKIYITKSLRGFNGYYQGEATIRNVGQSAGSTQTDFIELNVLFSADYNTPGSPGTGLNYAIYPETGYVALAERYNGYSNKLYAWNGTEQYEEIGTQWYLTNQIHSAALNSTFPQQKYLTNFDFTNERKPVYYDQIETVNFLHNFGVGGDSINQQRVAWYDKNKTLLGVRYFQIDNISTRTWTYYTMQCGLMKILSAINVTINYDQVKYYDVAVGFGGSGTTALNGSFSIPARFEVVPRTCDIDNKRLVWLNSKGGYDYLNFSLQGKTTISAERTEFQRYDGINGNYIGYRQRDTLAVDAQESETLVSDWLSEHQHNYLQDIIYSADVYLMKNEKLIPVIVTTDSFDHQYSNQGKLINATITVKYAHRRVTQNQ